MKSARDISMYSRFPKLRTLPLAVALLFCQWGPFTYGGESADADVALQRAVEARPSPRQLAWQAREMEAFFHFSLNTFIDSEGGSAPPSPRYFAPSQLNVKQWLDAAQSFGAKGIVLVCKHSDGFCLWPTRTTDYSVAASPWRDGKGDLVREVSEECRRRQLPFGVYLSPADLHHRGYGKDPAEYGDYFIAQLKELLTDYGPIAEVWFDGFGAGRMHSHPWQKYYATIRHLQPDAVIVTRGPDVRWIGNESGIGREAEWSVVTLPEPPENWDWRDMTEPDLGSRRRLARGGFPVWYPAVADVSLRRTWFWHARAGFRPYTADELLLIYEKSVGRNAGLLLNLSPDTRGLVAESDLVTLSDFGKRLQGWFPKSQTNEVPGEWRPTGTNQWVFDLNFPHPIVANTVVLREDIQWGQRVEHFSIWSGTNQTGARLLQGQTVGWKRILRLPTSAYSGLSIVVDECRSEPHLSKPEFSFRRDLPAWEGVRPAGRKE
ncbi:MAG TPA: alpha-L-fucosidase [Candidatus Limnocylindria bacterium]|nr:alpha-L-fucosidase [Candidatus Limnocylindria bacterium]